jgi:hypothetical protein
MAKNDWAAGDRGTKYNMNSGHWIVSGEIESGTDLRFYVGPGRVKFPHKTQTVGSGVMTSFLASNVKAEYHYTLFLKSDGLFLVSGTPQATTNEVPDSPRYDAVPLGRVFTGASVATGNLKGPWNSGVFDSFEQRGQVVSVESARQRIIYDQRSVAGWVSNPLSVNNSMGSIQAIVYSGLSYLNFTNYRTPGVTELQATICWIPSGGSSKQLWPFFRIQRAVDDTTLVEVCDEKILLANNNPDASGSGLTVTHLSAVDTVVSGEGYSLEAITAGDAINTAMRINSVYFSARPGLRGSQDREDDD